MKSAQNNLVNLQSQLQLIGDVTDRINRGRGLEEILESLFGGLRELIPCNRLSIGLLAEDGHTIVLGPVQSDGRILLRPGYKESIVGSSLEPLIQRGDTRILNDLEAYLRKKPKSRSTRLIVKEGMKSSLTVPLVVSDRRVGVMWFSSRVRDTYSKAHGAFMRTIAGHLAIIIEKGQLVGRLDEDNQKLAEANEIKARFLEKLREEVELRTAELRKIQQRQGILLQIAEAIHSTLELGRVFETLVKALRTVLPFERASILTLSENGSDLMFRELDPQDREHLGPDSVIPLEGSAAGRAIRDAKPFYTPDLKDDGKFYEDVYLCRAGIRSRVVIPLFVKQRPIGTFNLASNDSNRYSEEDLDFLSQLAAQISVAVANSEAYLEVERLKNRLEDENVKLVEVISRSPELSNLVGDSPPWRKVLRQVQMVSETDSTVLIQGETGTGKELIARAVHRLSRREGRPFIAINCAALSPELIASELFGHEKGAFTGAVSRKLGRIELAHEGTLFLDEVAELPLDTQVKLLRVLQERECERVGGTETIKVDVRVIAATNRSVERARAEGRLRDDLYFRLNVFPILVPPLRERKDDIEPLLACFLQRYAQKMNKNFDQVGRRTIERCMMYHWPGNVRELEHLVQRSVILCSGHVFDMNPLLEPDALSEESAQASTLNEAVKAHLSYTLKITRGRIYGREGAAALLGIKPSTLQSKLKKLGLDRRQAAGI